MKNKGAAFFAALVLSFGGRIAQGQTEPPAPSPIPLDYKQGDIAIGDGLAKLSVPSTFRYLGPEDSLKVIVDLWGNPKSTAPLGMLVPHDKDPDTEEGWGIIITFEEEGYVKDDDAEKIDYSSLLREMKDGMESENEERTKAGFSPIQLVGWATPPRYDKSAKKLYWAKELKFGDAPENTLNYNIRILGRRGVLVLNAVAGMHQLKEVEAATPQILGFVDFEPGHRYADYTPGTDRLAAYGIGALIAGKVAAKAGFFKTLVALLLAGKKFVVLLVVAIGAGIKKLFAPKASKVDSAG